MREIPYAEPAAFIWGPNLSVFAYNADNSSRPGLPFVLGFLGISPNNGMRNFALTRIDKR